MVAPTVRCIFVVLFTGEDVFCDRYDIGPPRTSVPTNDIEIVAFVYRPNKDLDVTLHNKKETRGSELSACFYLAF